MPEGNNWIPNSSQFECNTYTYMDAYEPMIPNEQIDIVLIVVDNDFMKNEWNYKYDPLAGIAFIIPMYSNVVFISPSIIYDTEAECAIAMGAKSLLSNNITGIDEAP